MIDHEQPPVAAAPLYDGEKLEMAAGHPVLTKFVSGDGDASKPLVVYVPGLANNARISYGGHKGSRSSDFLAHWFNHYGFPFLGVSYPLETEPEIMPPVSGDFSIRDWGRQVAVAMKSVVDEHALSSNVVVLAWSMGGKTLEPVTTEAKALGITVILYVSLAATPALWGLRSQLPGVTCSPAGYWNSPFLDKDFVAQLREQNLINGGRVIVDAGVYRREYFGATPAASGGWGFRFSKEEGKLVDDKWSLLEDGRADNFKELPIMAAIYPTSPLDLRHSIADKATWSFLMTYRFLADVQKVIGSRMSVEADDDAALTAALARYTPLVERLRCLIHAIPERMITSIEGNHFFFVGERGARETAEKVILFLKKAGEIGVEFEDITRGAEFRITVDLNDAQIYT